MTLITSISGIRGTIGGKAGNGLTPLDAVKFSAAYASWIKKRSANPRPKVVIGRDARKSGPMVGQLISGTLMGMGIDVLDTGLATTPTVEIAVPELAADGGIILTASHNPGHWNALKLLNEKGEFLSSDDGADILECVNHSNFEFSPVDSLGKLTQIEGIAEKHIEQVLSLDLVDVEAISKKRFKVAIDCVNSVGGLVLPGLLKSLGVEEIFELYCKPDGEFPHNPEPLPENLHEISKMVVEKKADIGFVVDPDVDRLAIICEDGTMFGEEYTLVAVADYVLSKTPGNTSSNLSSSRALKIVTEKHGLKYFGAAVGEVNVVEMMKEQKCVIGGEGNGGVIYPALHYGRDALVGIALFLSHLATSEMSCKALRETYPHFEMVKSKIELKPGTDVDSVLHNMKERFKDKEINTIDGLKIDFEDGWVHLRKSNTEPIIRIYAESLSREIALHYVEEITMNVNKIINSYKV